MLIRQQRPASTTHRRLDAPGLVEGVDVLLAGGAPLLDPVEGAGEEVDADESYEEQAGDLEEGGPEEVDGVVPHGPAGRGGAAQAGRREGAPGRDSGGEERKQGARRHSQDVSGLAEDLDDAQEPEHL